MSATLRIVIGVIVLLAAAAPALAQERILDFVSEVTVERNGDLLVVETIAVRAEGKIIQRGIVRDFRDTMLITRDGKEMPDIAVQSVTRNGTPENFVTALDGDLFRIRIGNAEQLLDPGRHEYVIRYRALRRTNTFPGYDMLWWPVTGSWTFPIERAEVRIAIPATGMLQKLTVYTGTEDDRGDDAEVVEQDKQPIVVRTKAALPPGNGLTVIVGWHADAVSPGEDTERKQ
jgi:hypothetical protein